MSLLLYVWKISLEKRFKEILMTRITGTSGTAIKDTWTKPREDGMGGRWGGRAWGEWWEGKADNYT